MTAQQNFAVRLHGQGVDIPIGVWIEGIGQAGRGIEPGERTEPFAFGSNESANPVMGFSRAMALRG
jgi:hypothetical protein